MNLIWFSLVMKMEINNIDELISCEKCGIVLLKEKVLKKTDNDSPNDYKGYWETEYKGNCPYCGNEISEWR